MVSWMFLLSNRFTAYFFTFAFCIWVYGSSLLLLQKGAFLIYVQVLDLLIPGRLCQHVLFCAPFELIARALRSHR